MRQVSPYICFKCQFLLMDILTIPIDVIVEPFGLGVVDQKTHKIKINDNVQQLLLRNSDKYRVEIRGIQLNNVAFKNSWPNYGHIDIDGSAWSQALTLPEREQSRKRKDEPFDVTSLFKTRLKKNHTFTIRKDRTPPGHEKNDDRFHYAIGLYLVQRLTFQEIIHYHKKHRLTSFLDTFKMICDRLFPKDEEDEVAVVCDNIKINMTCAITLKPVILPARGYKCTHVEVCIFCLTYSASTWRIS